MKKFVQLDGYDDQWFWLIESIDDIDDAFASICHSKLESMVKSDLYVDESKRHIRPDWAARVAGIQNNRPDYYFIVRKYGPIVVREIGSFMSYDPSKVTNMIMSDRFPRENSNAQIVVCENDYYPEQPWIKYLNGLFPDQPIDVLNLFRTRKDLAVELDVEYITFYTTFAQYDWFELILDTIIDNGWTDKKIMGYCVDRNRWEFPPYISDKMHEVFALGNVLVIVNEL